MHEPTKNIVHTACWDVLYWYAGRAVELSHGVQATDRERAGLGGIAVTLLLEDALSSGAINAVLIAKSHGWEDHLNKRYSFSLIATNVNCYPTLPVVSSVTEVCTG